MSRFLSDTAVSGVGLRIKSAVYVTGERPVGPGPV